MSPQAQVLVIDDGELDDVCALLYELHAEVVHLRGGAIGGELVAPSQLVVTTPRHAALTQDWPTSGGHSPRLTRICIVGEDSNTLRAMLRRMGFDYLIRRPFHPYALRLVLLRALYLGEERRIEDRVAIGYDIPVRSGLRRRTATLADLSIRGCRLLSETSYPVGGRLSLQIPSEITGGKPLGLRAKVIRCTESDSSMGYVHTLAMSFEKLSRDTKRRVFQILKMRAQEPSKLTDAMAEAAGAHSPAEVAVSNDAPSPARRLPHAAPATPSERRKHRRVAFEREVMSLGEEAGRTLMGRDLSMGGMNIDAGWDLSEGDEIRLALYGAPDDDPFVVSARVVRDNGGAGLGLAFEDVEPAVANRLEAMVSKLPAVELLQDGESEAMGSVVSQVLERVNHPDAPSAGSNTRPKASTN